MKKRFIAFFLSALMVGSALTVLSSCADKDKPGSSSGPGSGSGGSGATTTGTGETPPDQLKPGVPDGVRFDEDGERTQITFAVATSTTGTLPLRSIKLDADDVDESNTVDVAVAARNAAVEDQLGVEIVVNATNDGMLTGSQIYTTLAGGSNEYDVLGGYQYADIGLCLEGWLTDLNNITDDSGGKVDYLSVGKPWWPSYYNDAMQIGSNNARYWVTGDLSLQYIGAVYCFFVNEDLYQQDLQGSKSDLLTKKYGEETTYGDIYELVRRGDWTLDVLSEMAAKAHHQGGGADSTAAETWGVVMPVWDNINGMSISAGIEYSEKTSDGKINLLFDSGNASVIDFMTKMRTLLDSGHVKGYGANYESANKDFSSGNACFLSNRLYYAELYLNDMTTDYYIVPCPKLNFDQKEYRTSAHDAAGIYGISANSENKAAAAATLELMGYYSHQNVRPAYYDQVMKHQYTTDAGSAEMIDLMHDNVYTDPVFIWQFTDRFGPANTTKNLGFFLRNNVTASNPSVQLKKYQAGWKSGLDDLLEDIGKLETK